MSKRFLVILSVLIALASLISVASDNSSRPAMAQASHKAKVARTNLMPSDQPRGTSNGKAVANWLARRETSNPPPTQIGFLSGSQFSAGGGAFLRLPSVVADFNNDGNKDVASVIKTVGGAFSISVALGNGDGTFKPPVISPTTAACCDPIWVGDMNGDGYEDIVMAHAATMSNPPSVEVFLNNGEGFFTSNGIYSIPTPSDVVWATLRDVNGDGKLDFVAVDADDPGNVWTFLGNGDGTLQAPTSVTFPGQLAISSSTTFNPIAFGDFNGDGVLDFAGPDATTNQVTVYLGQPGGPFHAGIPLNTKDGVYDSCFVTNGDLNGDGKDEIVSANCYDDTITVFVNNGDGTFQQGVYYPAVGDTYPYPGASPVALSIADVNGDGHNDIVTSNVLSGDVSVFLGNGDGTVRTPEVGYATGGSPRSPALVADFNNDGKADLVVVDGEFSFVYLQGYGDGSFRTAMNYYPKQPDNGVQPNGVAIATGDFNGDGIPDFVIGNSKANGNAGITVFLSNPDGSLQPGVSYPGTETSYELEYVAVGDFNGDGKLDIAAADFYNGVIQIFTGNGDGTFQAGSIYATDSVPGANALELVAGDFNGDGKLDLAVINNHGAASANVGILLNNGQGGFKPVVNYKLSNLATEIAAADLNGDKKLDLVVPLSGTSAAPGSAVAILLGNGDGTFKPESDLQLVNGSNTFYNPYAVAVGDLNGDGKPDLAVTIQDLAHPINPNQGIAVALGNGDGTFKAPTLLLSSLQNPTIDVPLPGYVKMIDLNRDGHLDLVYTNSGFSTVGVMYGNGAGSFYDPVEYPAGRSASDLALADVNGDGAIDAVTTGNAYEFSGVTVLLNTSADTTSVNSSAPHSNTGLPVTLTAEITGSKVRGVTNIPTGSVTFYDGSTALATEPISGSGQAAYKASGLSTGTHNITAQYGGDTHYLANSASLQQVVGQAGSSASVTSSAKDYATPGLKVTFTATIASSVKGDTLVPTGKATFYDGTSELGSVSLNSSGVAGFSTSTLAIGSHSITAQYSGDGNFLTSTSPALPQMVVLPDYALGANPSKVAVNPGSTADYSITLTPAYGYDGTVTFTCPAKLPSGVSCSLPKPVAMNGQTATATLTVNTTGPSAAMFAPATANPRAKGTNLWASLSGIGMVGILLAGDWKKRNRRGVLIFLGIVALMMVLALAGCGSSSSVTSGGGTGGGGTPAGSYAITITAQGTAGTNGGNTAPHTINLTLVVN
jgi:hypothetical protein